MWGVPLAPSSASKWRLNTQPSLLKNLLGIRLPPKKERIKATIEKILVGGGWEIHFLVMLKGVAHGIQYMGGVHTWLDVCNHFLLGIRRQGSRPSPWKRNAKKQNGCLRRPYKLLWKEEKWKAKEKKKDIGIWMQSSKEEQEEKRKTASEINAYLLSFLHDRFYISSKQNFSSIELKIYLFYH